MSEQQPYLTITETITRSVYNPKYGDDRMCRCGHPYYRHFDTYENMANIGCKYCSCVVFVEESALQRGKRRIAEKLNLR